MRSQRERKKKREREQERKKREKEREREKGRSDDGSLLNLDLFYLDQKKKKTRNPSLNRWAILFVAQSHPLVRPVLQA